MAHIEGGSVEQRAPIGIAGGSGCLVDLRRHALKCDQTARRIQLHPRRAGNQHAGIGESDGAQVAHSVRHKIARTGAVPEDYGRWLSILDARLEQLASVLVQVTRKIGIVRKSGCTVGELRLEAEVLQYVASLVG